MVLRSYKHLIFSKKSILIALLSACMIVTGCDKKSERRLPSKKADGGKKNDGKTNPNGTQARGDAPCVPPQNGQGTNPNVANNNGQPQTGNQTVNNGQQQVSPNGQAVPPVDGQATNPSVAANGQPQQGATSPSNGAVPCVPGQQPITEFNGTPGTNNGASNGNQPSGSTLPTSPNGTHHSVLVPQNNNGTGNPNDPSTTQDHSRNGTTGSNNTRSQHNLSQLDDFDLIKGRDKGSSVDDLSDSDSDTNNESDKSKNKLVTKKMLILSNILKELGNFYVQASMTAVSDKSYHADNYFDRLARLMSRKKLYISRDGRYLDESKDQTCSDLALELEIDKNTSYQKLYIYDCQNETKKYEEPVLEFKVKGSSWAIRTSTQGLAQMIGSEKLGYISINDVNTADAIPFNPRCTIKISNDESDSTNENKINTLNCKFWGQQYVSQEKVRETYILEEFKYDHENGRRLEVTARMVDVDGHNLLCRKNTLKRSADDSDKFIHMKDLEDDDCEKNNKAIQEEESARLKSLPMKNNLALPATPESLANSGQKNTTIIPNTIVPLNNSFVNQQAEQQLQNPTPLEVNQDPSLNSNINAENSEMNSGFPQTMVNGVVTNPNVDQNGLEGINNSMGGETLNPPAVTKRHNIIRNNSRNNPESVAPPEEIYNDGQQQLDFSSEVAP